MARRKERCRTLSQSVSNNVTSDMGLDLLDYCCFCLHGRSVLILRILDEEKSLKEELPGYAEYMQKVRYRLVPYLW